MKLRIFLLFLFFLSSCQMAQPGPNQKKKKDPTKELIKKNQELDKKNQELAQKLENLESKSKQDASAQQRRLASMDKTISLMEQNLAQMNQNPAAKKPALQPPAKATTNPKPKAKPTPKFGPQPSPDSSFSMPKRASTPLIRSINEPILPPPNPSAQAQKGLLQNPEGSAKRVVMVPPSEDEPTQRASKKLPPDTPFSVPRAEVAESSYMDPNLDSPHSPIVLQHTPGAKLSYNEAFRAFSKQEYAHSVELNDFFLSRFPNDHDADNAQFWIGQAHFEEKSLNEAETAFRKVLVNYKHGPTAAGHKTPDAIFMLGKIYKAKLRPKRAKYYFDQVIKRYPGSHSARKALKEKNNLQRP
ncbi:MAG: tetratricopeptide repeat protein [SAR324 cluster bacterium]|nr:tetratricopeptide repeat protein [SAR324 cluster bacterium]